jgi:hypothetical protein
MIEAPTNKRDQSWKGNPEKEQQNDAAKLDLEKWHETNAH